MIIVSRVKKYSRFTVALLAIITANASFSDPVFFSGYYQPSFWNNDWERKNNNNCYSYALNTVQKQFPQPGDSWMGSKWMPRSQTSCQMAVWGTALDGTVEAEHYLPGTNNVTIQYLGTSELATCPSHASKIALFVRTSSTAGAKGKDFHYFRYDGLTGTWSSKMGNTSVTNKVILDRRDLKRLESWEQKDIDYIRNLPFIDDPRKQFSNKGMHPEFCGYFCTSNVYDRSKPTLQDMGIAKNVNKAYVE